MKSTYLFTYLLTFYFLRTYILTSSIYLSFYNLPYQPTSNLPINYLAFLFTYLKNDMK
jgi:hypothetical protein